MGTQEASADRVPEVVLNGFGRLLTSLGFQYLPVNVSVRKSPAFVVVGALVDIEAYAVLPAEFEGVPILRKLIETLTADEAVEVCKLLRRLRSEPVEPVSDVKEDDDGGQCS